jgi:hypothetical protein
MSDTLRSMAEMRYLVSRSLAFAAQRLGKTPCSPQEAPGIVAAKELLEAFALMELRGERWREDPPEAGS